MPPRVLPGKCWQIVGMWRAGKKQREISRILGVPQGTVSKVLRRFRNKGNVNPGVSTGRPKITSIREDRLLLRECQRNRTTSAETLRHSWQNQTGIRVSRVTVNRRLLERGLRARRPARKPFLKPENKQKRLDWAKNHENYQLRHWRRVVF